MSMQNKICSVFNYASFYREPIFKLMDKELNCDFYFGDKTSSPIKKMDYDSLIGFKKEFKFIKLLGNFYWLKGTFGLLFKKYDTYILTGEAYCLSNWLLLLYGKVTRKKVYLWTHGWYGKEKFITRILKKWFYKLSDGLFLYGDYAKNLMINEGFSERKLIPIYNSLDHDLHLKIRQTLKLTSVFKDYFNNDNPTFIYVGRLQKSKKINLVFEAISLLKKKNILANFILVGESSDIGFTIEEMKDMNIAEQVWFYGPCFDEYILGELFYNSIACVSPGNIGLTAIHSLTFGTPIITHNNFKNQAPEFEALIDGETGSFFKEHNVEDLANKMEDYISMDQSQRKVLKKNGYKIIDDRYNPHYQISVMKRVLSENINN